MNKILPIILVVVLSGCANTLPHPLDDTAAWEGKSEISLLEVTSNGNCKRYLWKVTQKG